MAQQNTMIQLSQIKVINNALQYFSDSITCFKDTISKEQTTLPNALSMDVEEIQQLISTIRDKIEQLQKTETSIYYGVFEQSWRQNTKDFFQIIDYSLYLYQNSLLELSKRFKQEYKYSPIVLVQVNKEMQAINEIENNQWFSQTE
jgi:hypothetical protein